MVAGEGQTHASEAKAIRAGKKPAGLLDGGLAKNRFLAEPKKVQAMPTSYDLTMPKPQIFT